MKLPSPRKLLLGQQPELWLPFALKKLEELRKWCALHGMSTATRAYEVPNAQVVIKVAASGTDHIIINGSGGDYRLFSFSTLSDSTLAQPPRYFSLTLSTASDKEKNKLTTADLITAVGDGFPALGYGLTYSIDDKADGHTSIFASRDPTFHSQCLLKLKRMLKRGDNFARQYWRYVATNMNIARAHPETNSVEIIPVVADDCLFSTWDSVADDCWVALGSWQHDPTDTVGIEADIVAGASSGLHIPREIFVGVILRYSELVSSGLPVVLSEYYLDANGNTVHKAVGDKADATTTTVRDVPSSIKRDKPTSRSTGDLYSLGLNSSTVVWLVGNATDAFLHRTDFYNDALVNPTGEPPGITPVVRDTHTVTTVTHYKIDPVSVSLITEIVDLSAIGALVSWTETVGGTTDWSATATNSGYDVGIYLFAPTGYTKIGQQTVPATSISWGPTSPSPPLVNANIVSDLPYIPALGSGITAPPLFIPEYGRLISQDPSSGSWILRVEKFGGMAHAWSQVVYDEESDGTTTINVASSSSNSVHVNTGSDVRSSVRTGFVGINNSSINPSGSVLMLGDGTPLSGFSGGVVFWYRDGPTGVAVFNLDSSIVIGSAAAVSLGTDIKKYKDVCMGVIKNTDATYEAPATILARITPKISFVANNFMPPSLIPWVLTYSPGAAVVSAINSVVL